MPRSLMDKCSNIIMHTFKICVHRVKLKIVIII